jgi:hypothetical protein
MGITDPYNKSITVFKLHTFFFESGMLYSACAVENIFANGTPLLSGQERERCGFWVPLIGIAVQDQYFCPLFTVLLQG